MIAVWMVQSAVDKIVDVVAMWHLLMSAVWTVFVRAVDLRRAFHGICCVDCDDMLVHVIPMHMVEMAVVKIIHVAPMANGDVSTIRAMLMGVVGMVFLGTCVHCRRSLLGCAIEHPVIPPLEEIGSQPTMPRGNRTI
jgi:hypothetical protein